MKFLSLKTAFTDLIKNLEAKLSQTEVISDIL